MVCSKILDQLTYPLEKLLPLCKGPLRDFRRPISALTKPLARLTILQIFEVLLQSTTPVVAACSITIHLHRVSHWLDTDNRVRFTRGWCSVLVIVLCIELLPPDIVVRAVSRRHWVCRPLRIRLGNTCRIRFRGWNSHFRKVAIGEIPSDEGRGGHLALRETR